MSAPRDFWSRRKQAVEQEARSDSADQLAAQELQAQQELEQQTDEEILEDLGLQDPETLEAGDDFSAFMAKAVPARLRNRALRKLWLSDPALANLDALLDYGEDFTVEGLDVENIQTVYQVGKGMLGRVLEDTDKTDNPVLDAEEPAASVVAEVKGSEDQIPDQEQETAAAVTGESVVVTHDDPLETEQLFVPKKRMRFVFEAQA
jgi:uncharacterized protein DUF3306